VTTRERLAEAVSLREGGDVEEALSLLVELQRDHPNDPQVNLQCAWAHDKLGLEREAVPFYEKAIDIGLEGQDLRDALLGLGSTYRALGEGRLAEATLAQGVERYADDRAMQVFYAMALYSNGQPKKACELLLRIVVDTTADEEILSYRPAIDIYARDLDEVWT
jgi:tetratricopeptide (TPR) repeat protein